MYICQICGGSPDKFDRMVLRLDDGKVRAEIKGHIKCIGELSDKLKENRTRWKNRKGNKDKIMSTKVQFKMAGLDVEEYIVD